MNENIKKRILKVNLLELAGAVDDGTDTIHYYLDLETGRILLVTEKIQSQLEELHKKNSGCGVGKRGV